VDALDRGVVAGGSGRCEHAALDVLDDDAEPDVRGRERGEDRCQPLGGQRVAADDLARDDLAGPNRRRSVVAAQ